MNCYDDAGGGYTSGPCDFSGICKSAKSCLFPCFHSLLFFWYESYPLVRNNRKFTHPDFRVKSGGWALHHCPAEQDSRRMVKREALIPSVFAAEGTGGFSF